ncbi:MAG: radical SAM protein [Candidatus Heimdallarchaeota archaeon]|nr:radical SAM protein [Candidatus Heimdallarchaeota archaeon]
MKVSYKILVVDATGAGKGRRRFTRDAIGCGPRSICGVLEQLSLESQIFRAEEILQKGFPPGFSSLFISGMSMDKIAIKRLINLWRQDFEGKVIVGGSVTSELEDALTATKANIIVIGEGEFTVQEIIKKKVLLSDENNIELRNISGIGYFSPVKKIKINDFRTYSSREEFRTFTPSTRRIKDYSNFFWAKVYVECVRGCSNFGGTKLPLRDGRKCSECGYCEEHSLVLRANCPQEIPPGCGFCSVPSLFGPARSRAREAIINEIDRLLVQGVKRIVLSAPDFLDFGRDELVAPEPLVNPKKPPANEQAIEALLSQIVQLNKISQGKAWVEVENVKANLFTERLAKIISDYLPDSSFSIGCETGSKEHAKLLGRPSIPDETLQAVKIAHKYGLNPHVYFIHSLPGQTRQIAKETAALIKKMAPFVAKITIYRFRPLPLSAFGDFPVPKPAVKNPASQLISEAAYEVNLQKKKELKGKKVKVIISEPNYRDKNGAMGYILNGGPIVAVKNARERIGEILMVKIEKAITDKLVLGTIVPPKET